MVPGTRELVGRLTQTIFSGPAGGGVTEPPDERLKPPRGDSVRYGVSLWVDGVQVVCQGET